MEHVTQLGAAWSTDGAIALPPAPPPAHHPFPTSLLVLIGTALLYLAYRRSLPNPLPGIPHNKAAASSILGDLAELRALAKQRGRPKWWLSEQGARHDSALVQVFMTPFSNPSLVLSDFREAQDILLRHGREFDRGERFLQATGGILPHHHISMKTSDPRFKANRDLMRDVMTPHFLDNVSAPTIHRHMMDFIELWRLKASAADRRPFKAADDIHVVAFDIIKSAALGKGDGRSLTLAHLSRVRSQLMTEAGSRAGRAGPDDLYLFPDHEGDGELQAHMVQQDALGRSLMHPSPWLFHKVNNLSRSMRVALENRERMLDRQISLASNRLEAGHKVESALDYMIRRGMASAAKAGRRPDLGSPGMREELYGYIGAGLDTTSTTIQWTIKYLCRHATAQQRLRQALRAAFPAAAAQARQPTVVELTGTQVPYLEAVIAESLRLSAPIPTVVRSTTVDTVILGHPVPAGTQVFLNLQGPSLTRPALTVDETLRSASAREARDRCGSWAGTGAAVEEGASTAAAAAVAIDQFEPERWLRRGGGGDGGTDGGLTSFDPYAGPFLSFSAGLRGCFGRRLACLQLRIVLTLLVWNLQLLPLPPDLNTFEGVDGMTTKPSMCFVRLQEVS